MHTTRPYLNGIAVVNHERISYVTSVLNRRTMTALIPTLMVYRATHVLCSIPGVIGGSWIKNRSSPVTQYEWYSDVNLYDYIKDDIVIMNMIGNGIPLRDIYTDTPLPNLPYGDWYCMRYKKDIFNPQFISEQLHALALYSTKKSY